MHRTDGAETHPLDFMFPTHPVCRDPTTACELPLGRLVELGGAQKGPECPGALQAAAQGSGRGPRRPPGRGAARGGGPRGPAHRHRGHGLRDGAGGGSRGLTALACVLLLPRLVLYLALPFPSTPLPSRTQVGVGPGGERSALARVVLVNEEGHVLLDAHVRPAEKVTDYRTAVSGVLPQHLQHAPPLAEVQARVARMLAGRVLVGHALENDLQALLLSHPRRDTRDTATYPPFMTRVGGRFKPRALRVLAREQLGLTVRGGVGTEGRGE